MSYIVPSSPFIREALFKVEDTDVETIMISILESMQVAEKEHPGFTYMISKEEEGYIRVKTMNLGFLAN